MDAGNLLKPMLGQGELQCIGAIALNEYRKYIENDLDLECRFQHCEQSSFEDMISNIHGLCERYELHHGSKILMVPLFPQLYLQIDTNQE
ncbi:chaperone protein ClpB4, mitochondrial [Artemisia annua]|uniref:Chaperone protein ClpB4, mitochondrial n=1 Tax=Artemisia annua TaxID=35608 RepID=A0A2U1NNI5_ARTAN|nr:chaperone protein ClpB4, mitochondrial [Artemisia annua]